MPNKVGRPLLFKTVKEVEDKINEYFNYCDNRLINGYDNKTNEQFAYISPEPYTMSGLAYYLGIDRKTLLNYSKKEEFFPTIKRARNKVEMDVERRMNDKGSFTAGLIFNAKNNFGWTDKTETDITSGGKIIPILGGMSLEGMIDVQKDDSDQETSET